MREDNEGEVNIFLDFLHHREYPQHRNIIFLHFPKLKEMIGDDEENERAIVESFLKNTREKNKEKIGSATKYIQNEIEQKGERTLTILADLMDYGWPENNEKYVLVPTIFPMCPFNGNTFFFSIYKALEGVTEYPKVLAVAMHEISHMILFEILREKNISLDSYTTYFIKELIAPILVYQDNFTGVFKKEIVGNYNVLEIYFNVDRHTIKAFDYFLEKFNKNKEKGLTFGTFLDDMISICLKIKESIKEKRDFDNTHGIQILKNSELLKQFREPILVER